MPDLSSPESCIKLYENRPRRLIDIPFLPTLKPEEPIKRSKAGCLKIAQSANFLVAQIHGVTDRGLCAASLIFQHNGTDKRGL